MAIQSDEHNLDSGVWCCRQTEDSHTNHKKCIQKFKQGNSTLKQIKEEQSHEHDKNIKTRLHNEQLIKTYDYRELSQTMHNLSKLYIHDQIITVIRLVHTKKRKKNLSTMRASKSMP